MSSAAETAVAKPGAGLVNPRFKSIYDAMKIGDYRSAVRAAERKEIANTPLAKVLKAVCMLRSNFGDEAYQLAYDVMRSKPTDMPVLKALNEVFEATGNAGLAATALENAVAAVPDSEPLYRQLAFAYLRAGDWKKLQGTAMKLAKVSGKPYALAWAALALAAQSNDPVANGEGAAPVAVTGGGRGFCTGRVTDVAALRSLAVAEALLLRSLDGLAPAERDSESLGLLAHIMVRQGKAAEAYALLTGKYAYLPPATEAATAPAAAAADADAGAASPSSPSETGGAGATDAPKAGEDAGEEDAESNPYDEEDNYERADGKGGRGTVPGPFQPVDQLRYCAYLLTLAAADGKSGPGASAAAEALVTDPAGGAAVGSWTAAKHAYGALLTRIDAEDWAYHQGLVYAWTQETAAAIAAALSGGDAAALVSSHLAPVADAGAAAVLTGVASVDALLRPHTASAAATGSATAHRGSALALVLLQGARCELAHRLVQLGSGAPAGVVAAATTALAEGAASYARLLARYLERMGNKAAAFGDVRAFLVPFLPAVTLPLPAVSAPAASASYLAGFLCPQPAILSMPYSPTTLAGSAADVATAVPLFTFSFLVPAAVTTSALVTPLQALREKHRPDGAMAAALGKLIAAARSAAVASGNVNADGSVKRKDKFDERTVDEADPHGVKAALAPAAELSFSAEQEQELADVKGRIRYYTTAMQVLRYLGVTSVSTASAVAGGAAGIASAVASCKAVAAELSSAWEHTALLGAATVGGQREVQEGDDVALLAVHTLWDAGLIYLRASVTAPEAGELSRTACVYAARQFFIESAVFLEQLLLFSPYNGQLRLCALRVINWMGAAVHTLQHIDGLRVKHISWDTLGHTALPVYSRMWWQNAVQRHVQSVLQFHGTSIRDSSKPRVLSLRCGTYSETLDLVRMEKRLSSSIMHSMARALVLDLSLVQASRSLPETKNMFQRYCVSSEPLDASPAAMLRARDNDDRDVIAIWSAPTGLALAEARGAVGAYAALAKAADTSAFAATALELSKAQGAGVADTLCALVDAAQAGSGGSYERLVRRVARENFVVARNALSQAVYRALTGDAAAADAQLQRFEAVAAAAGFPLTGAAAAAATDAENSMRAALFSDLVGAAVPLLETGVASERTSARGAQIACLWHAARAAAALAGEGETGPAAASKAWPDAQGHLEALTATITRMGADAAAAKYLAAPAPVAGAAVEGRIPNPALTPTGGALDPAFLAEAYLIVQHTAPMVMCVLQFLAKVVVQAVAKSGSKDKDAGKGKGKAGKGAAAAAAAPAAAPATDAIVATRDALAAAIAAVTATLDGLLKGLNQTRALIEGPLPQALAVVLTGFDQTASSVPVVAANLPDLPGSKKEEKEKSAKEKAKAAKAEAAAKAAAAAAKEPGAAFLDAFEEDRKVKLKSGAETALQNLGASYTHTVESLRSEIAERLTTLRSIRVA